MISHLTTRWTCYRAARRLQRYLDADPAAPLSATEIRRLEGHLATCERCLAAAEDLRDLRRTLARWSQPRTPDPALVARVRLAAERHIADHP